MRSKRISSRSAPALFIAPENSGSLRLYKRKEDSWRTMDDDWLMQAEALALFLDTFTNNSSLVLAIELMESKKVLLFAADAQTGNWLSWDKVPWVDKNVNTDDLLDAFQAWTSFTTDPATPWTRALSSRTSCCEEPAHATLPRSPSRRRLGTIWSPCATTGLLAPVAPARVAGSASLREKPSPIGTSESGKCEGTP
jgi:hypothetical protein